MRDQQVLDRLGRLRRRIRLLLIVDGVGTIVAAGMVGVLVAATIDYLVWLPAAARLVVAGGFCVGLGVAIWGRVVRPLIARIELGEIAAMLDSRFAALQDRLASAVGFMRAPPGASAAMVGRVLAQANEAVARLPLDSMVRWRRPILMMSAALITGAGAVGVAVAAPWFVTTGLQRYVKPFGSARWPRRVLIEPMTGDAKRPAGGWFEARARITRGRSESLRVYVQAESPTGRRTRHVMTYDPKNGRYVHLFKDLHQDFSYWFEAGDDTTLDRAGRFQVAVVPRPAVWQAELALTDPAYVGSSQPRRLVLQDAPVSVLAGSRARLTVSTNKPLAQDQQGRARVTLTLPGGARLAMARSDGSGRRFEAAFDVEHSGRMTVHVVDENGFDNQGGTTYALSVRDDEPPHVVIVEPQAVTEVTPSATLAVTISGDDDFGVTRVAVEASVGRIRADRPLEFDLTDRMQARKTPGRSVVSVNWSWDLRPMALKPGDVVSYRAVARDNYELGGRRHPASRSAEMRLKVISPEQLADRVRDELMLLKNALRSMLGEQEAAGDEVETVAGETDAIKGLSDLERESLRRLVGRQTRLASRAGHLGKRFGKLIKRLDANRSDDRDVRRRCRDASSRLASLGAGTMAQAAEQLALAGEAKGPTDQTKAMRAAAAKQKVAADELRSLLAGMERWGDFQDVVRHVQQLLDQQERATESTQRLGARTLGRRPEDLPARLSAELRQRSRQQHRLAEDLGRLKENMARLADETRTRDPAAATALDDARQAAEASRLVSKLNEAADAVARNRIAQAQAAQRASEDGFREMLARLERRQTERLAVLSKRLQGAVAKVQTLMKDQEKLLSETKRLQGSGDAPRREQLTRRQQGLARASGAIAEEVAKVDRAARPARGIRRAGGRMNRAAARLGQGKPDQAAAEQTEAVRQLAEVLETLEKLRAQAEAEMAAMTLSAIAEEMKKLRDGQATLNGRLDALVRGQSKGATLSRVALRRLDKLANAQRELAGQLAQLRVRVRTAPVYDWVMGRIGADMGRLAERFDRRLVGLDSTALAEHILKRLGHLLTALQQEPPEEDTREDEFAGGGGRGAGATKDKPVPTVAELMVIKAMQSDLNQRTRRADLKGQMTEQVSEEQLEALRGLGREQEQIRRLTEKIVQGAKR